MEKTFTTNDLLKLMESAIKRTPVTKTKPETETVDNAIKTNRPVHYPICFGRCSDDNPECMECDFEDNPDGWLFDQCSAYTEYLNDCEEKTKSFMDFSDRVKQAIELKALTLLKEALANIA